MWGSAESGDLAVALIPAVWAFLGIVVMTLGTIAVQHMKGRKETAVSPPTNGNGASLLQVARDVAHDIGQLDQRANDTDEALDLQDKRIDRLERWADRHDPDWQGR